MDSSGNGTVSIDASDLCGWEEINEIPYTITVELDQSLNIPVEFSNTQYDFCPANNDVVPLAIQPPPPPIPAKEIKL